MRLTWIAGSEAGTGIASLVLPKELVSWNARVKMMFSSMICTGIEYLPASLLLMAFNSGVQQTSFRNESGQFYVLMLNEIATIDMIGREPVDYLRNLSTQRGHSRVRGAESREPSQKSRNMFRYPIRGADRE
jgi:hypothetical protein